MQNCYFPMFVSKAKLEKEISMLKVSASTLVPTRTLGSARARACEERNLAHIETTRPWISTTWRRHTSAHPSCGTNRLPPLAKLPTTSSRLYPVNARASQRRPGKLGAGAEASFRACCLTQYSSLVPDQKGRSDIVGVVGEKSVISKWGNGSGRLCI